MNVQSISKPKKYAFKYRYVQCTHVEFNSCTPAIFSSKTAFLNRLGKKKGVLQLPTTFHNVKIYFYES